MINLTRVIITKAGLIRNKDFLDLQYQEKFDVAYKICPNFYNLADMPKLVENALPEWDITLE